MGITSSLLFTVIDQNGNPRTEAWLTLEFSGAYPSGGQAFDLSPYFSLIENIVPFPMSGGQSKAPISASASIEVASGSLMRVTPVVTDYATPASTRFMLGGFSALSGIAREVMDLTSGLTGSVSGIRFGARVLGY